MLANTMSRQPDADNATIIDLYVAITPIQFSSERLKEIREESIKDEELVQLKYIINKGWPMHRNQTPDAIKKYWSFRDELTCNDDIILKRQQVLIPPKQRKHILMILHTAHQVIEKTRLLAQQHIYWPGMNDHISTMISQCDICQEVSRRQQLEPLLTRDVPEQPWQTIATDMFEYNKDHYLLVID